MEKRKTLKDQRKHPTCIENMLFKSSSRRKQTKNGFEKAPGTVLGRAQHRHAPIESTGSRALAREQAPGSGLGALPPGLLTALGIINMYIYISPIYCIYGTCVKLLYDFFCFDAFRGHWWNFAGVVRVKLVDVFQVDGIHKRASKAIFPCAHTQSLTSMEFSAF